MYSILAGNVTGENRQNEGYVCKFPPSNDYGNKAFHRMVVTVQQTRVIQQKILLKYY